MISWRVALSVSLFAGLAGGCASSALPAAPAAPATTTTALASPSAPASPLPASQAPTGLPGSSPQSIPPTDTDLEPGTYAFDFPLMDQPGRPFPRVLITLPAGWSSFHGFGLQSRGDTPREHFVGFWNVTRVYSHPCQSKGAMLDPGPTVDGLADTLAKIPLRNATAPVAVTLGGYHGRYLEWSVPNDADFSTCDTLDFESWTAYGTGGTDRYQQAPGQTDRLWILDVEGRRLVIDAAYLPGTTAEDRADSQKIVDSIAFER